MSPRLLAVCTATALAVLSWMMASRWAPSDGKHPAPKLVERSVSATPGSSTVATPEVRPVSPHQPATWNALTEYNAIRNGRVFVLEAARHPQRGGAYYASWVADTCLAVKDLGLLELGQPEVDEVGVDGLVMASHALNSLRARCDQLTDDELASYSGQALRNSPAGKTDVIGIAVGRLIDAKGKGIPAVDAAVQAILETGDPLVIDRLNLQLIARHHSDGGFLYYDGQKYPLSESAGVSEALYLLPCELGLACGIEDPMLAMQCVRGGGCYQSRSERVLEELAKGDRERFEAIRALATSMATAVRARAYGKFLTTR
jgi:hypothetical protein